MMRAAIAIICLGLAVPARGEVVSDAQVNLFLKTMGALRGDVQIAQFFSTTSPVENSSTSLRQFTEVWAAAPEEIVTRARAIAKIQGNTFENFVVMGDRIVCVISSIDSPNALDELKKQIDDELAGAKSDTRSEEHINKIRNLKEEVEFCQNTPVDFRDIVVQNEKRIRESLE